MMTTTTMIIDAVLVPAALILLLLYHAFLLYKVRRHPMQTTMGINQKARKMWVQEMMTENEKKNVLAVQTLRNSIMESSLMATTAVLLVAALAAYFSFVPAAAMGLTKRLAPTDVAAPGHVEASAAAGAAVYIASGGGSNTRHVTTVIVSSSWLKPVLIVGCFMASFVCHTQSITFLNQVNYMVNLPSGWSRHVGAAADCACPVNAVWPPSGAHIAHLIGCGSLLHSLGSRIFYVAFPLLLWVFGAIPMFLCSAFFVCLFYTLDFHTLPPNINHVDYTTAHAHHNDSAQYNISAKAGQQRHITILVEGHAEAVCNKPDEY